MIQDPYLYECSECDRELDERWDKPWMEVTGWERHRDQGGTNHVALRKPTGLAMCNACMTKLQSGLPATQLSLSE